MSKYSASPVESQVHALIQSLFINRDWDSLKSLLDENVQWHATDPDQLFIGWDQVQNYVQNQMQHHCETLIHSSLPTVSALGKGIQLITVKALLQEQDCHLLFLTLILDEDSGKFHFIQINPSLITSKALQNQELALSFLPDQMPGGIFHCLFDEPLTLLQTSDSFLKLTGYTREEIRTDLRNSFRALIDPRDYHNTLNEVRNQLRHGCDKELQFRLLRKNAEPIWVLDKGRYLQDEWGRQYFCCILVDITESKKIQEELRLSLERYEIIMKQTHDIIFEWNVQTDQLNFSEHWVRQLGYRPHTSTRDILNDERAHLSQESRQLFASIRDAVLNGQMHIEEELQLLNRDYEPLWYRIRITTQFDQTGKPVKVIGLLSDIDEEKRKSQLLLDKAQKDALTQYYNKETIQKLIEEQLQQHPESRDALMIIDIDDFKHVNDTLGHLFGDAFLIEATSRIRQLFRKEDILGRIGGDEFLVFLKNVPDVSLVEKKASQILNAFTNIEIRSQKIFNISCSIGIALTRENETLTYHQLFQRADQALYLMKNQGKQSYAVYSEVEKSRQFALSKGRTAVSTRIDSNANQMNAFAQVGSYVFSTLYNALNLSESIDHILGVVGLHFNVSRVYVFENSSDDQYCSNTFEWCNEGISSEKELLQHVSYRDDLGGNYLDYFDENGIFYCQDILALDPAHIKILKPQNIQSMLQCAIKDQGTIKGYIGFDDCREKRLWNQDQIDVLTHIAEILSVFLLKRRAEEHIQSLQKRLDQNSDEIRNPSEHRI